MATPPSSGEFERDVVVIGGGGHVGLPLAIAFADRGARVAIYDVSEVCRRAGERGQAAVRRARRRYRCLSARSPRGRLTGLDRPGHRGTAEHVVVVIGTPVDEHLNPDQSVISKASGGCSPYLRDGQLLVLRSTVFPGVTALVEKMVAGLGAYRGRLLPGADRRGQGDDRALRAAADRLRALAEALDRAATVLPADHRSSSSRPEEAELAKLFTNTWRYIKFAAANQFYMMANDRASTSSGSTGR